MKEEIKENKTEEKIQEKKEEKEIININKINQDNIVNNTNTSQNTTEKNNTNITSTQTNHIPEVHPPKKKKISFKEAQQQIKDFKIVLEDIEKKIKNKYGDCLPDFSYEEHLPVNLKTKLITSFFESEEIKNIINKVNQEQKSDN